MRKQTNIKSVAYKKNGNKKASYISEEKITKKNVKKNCHYSLVKIKFQINNIFENMFNNLAQQREIIQRTINL